MNLTQRQLRLFVATASLANISRASELLHISQPALSRALQEFEAQLGVVLFSRSTRKIALTEVGERFLPVAQRLLRDLNQAASDVSALASPERGSVAIAVGTAYGSSVMPSVLLSYQKAHAQVQVRLVDDNSGGITRRVAQGEVDIGIGSPVGDTSALECVKLLSAPLGLLASPAHFDLNQAQLPLLKESADTSIMQLLHSHGSAIVGQMNGGVEVSSLALQLALAHAGVGVAVVSALGASHRDAQGLKFVPIQPLVEREIFVMHRREHPLSPAASAFLAAVVGTTTPPNLHASVRFYPETQ